MRQASKVVPIRLPDYDWEIVHLLVANGLLNERNRLELFRKKGDLEAVEFTESSIQVLQRILKAIEDQLEESVGIHLGEHVRG